MILLDLADAARKSGLTVVEQPGWKSRGHGQLAAVQTVILHHTAGPATGEAPSLRTVQDGRPGLEGPLSHLVLGRSGTVYVVASGLCWHAGDTMAAWQGNAYSIGIEAEATGTAEWPTAQYVAYLRLVRALCAHYGVPFSKVLGHKEVARPLGRKVDPNFDMAVFRTALNVQEDDMSWTDTVTNAFGDKVQAVQILNGIELRLADLQKKAADQKTTAGAIDLDALAVKVADVLAARLKS